MFYFLICGQICIYLFLRICFLSNWYHFEKFNLGLFCAQQTDFFYKIFPLLVFHLLLLFLSRFYPAICLKIFVKKFAFYFSFTFNSLSDWCYFVNVHIILFIYISCMIDRIFYIFCLLLFLSRFVCDVHANLWTNLLWPVSSTMLSLRLILHHKFAHYFVLFVADWLLSQPVFFTSSSLSASVFLSFFPWFRCQFVYKFTLTCFLYFALYQTDISLIILK